MKTLISSLFIAFSLLSVEVAANPLPDHWIDAESETVYFAPLGRLQIEYRTLALSAEYYGELTLAYLQDRQAFDTNDRMIRDAYPALKRVRATVPEASEEKLRIRLPELGLEREVKTYLTSMGPEYAVRVRIPKSLHEKTALLVQNASLRVQTDGAFTVQVPVSRVLEEARISSDSCAFLTESGTKLMNVLVNANSAIERAFDGLSFQYASTEEMLRREYLYRCVSLPQPLRIQSFQQMAEAELKLSPPASRWIEAQTRKREVRLQNVEQRPVKIDYRRIGGNE